MPRRVTDSPPLRASTRHDRHPGRLGAAAPLGARDLRPARKGPDWGLALILLCLAGGAGAIGWYGYEMHKGSGPAAGSSTVYAPRPSTTIPGATPDGTTAEGWPASAPPAAPGALEQVDVGSVGTHMVPNQSQSRQAPRYDNPTQQLGTMRTTEPPKD